MIINDLEADFKSNLFDRFDYENVEDYSKILCIHCKRTKDNGIRCMGICVADNDY
tara:strand:- start:75 stop:239 length:165 start_codon:yes stop_codon:yes gene_type:complete